MDLLSDRTRLIAAATRRGEGRRPVNPPIERASTMLSDAVGDMRDASLGPLYGIDGTASQDGLRRAISDLEGAESCWLAPSGLAAVTLPLLALTKPGDEILTTDAVYGPVRRFLTRYMAARGVTARFHPAEASAEEVAALVSDATRLMLIEAPGSLTMEMIDVPLLAEAARARGVWTVMDNTWAAGLAFKPLAHGVDVSVQALTKYAGGHSDLMLGAVSASDPALVKAIAETYEDVGLCVSPDDAWLALRGLRTLPLRYAEQQRSMMQVATWLADQAEVSRVLHPALPGDPGHLLWSRDFTGAASLFGVVMQGGDTQTAHAFLDALSLFGLGYSWGGFESLITYETPQMAFRVAPPTLEGPLLRLHIGLESPSELIADLEIGLAAWRTAVG
ncbi:cystathionine beta-lyase [Brevundimonas sp. NIBR11]|uniref:cystathionine beta-lyase n=1 Tax=Brevundimonas sp. NIBR11 TaxID=3015999 RepID=UPI0022F0921E|nr:cystathionine beta-lyase [Brevundimonas sp. NIBR11]WGM31086.1 Cystathionine beta-lyase [Brevundimonas sp. NIBR11]